MSLDVGTLVQPYTEYFQTPQGGRTCFLDGITDECIGIIVNLEPLGKINNEDIGEATVRWVQVCPNHLEVLTTVTRCTTDELWEIGALY